MAGWLPILKAVLPHLTAVITSAIPHFSNRGSPDSIPQQIAELQIAATKNAESLRVLAEQVEQIVRATEQGATSLEQALTRIEQTNSALEKRIHDTSAGFRTVRLIATAAGVIAVIALLLAIIASVV